MSATEQTTGSLVVPLPSGKSKEVPYIVELPATSSSEHAAVLLLHGAGGDASSGHLPQLAAACVASGWPCLRITCRGGNLDHRIAVTKALLARAAGLPGMSTVRAFVLAGHSMGARVACAVATEDNAQQQQRKQQQQQAGDDALPSVCALMLFSFPLHPPGKPQQLRDGVLAALPTALPVLVARGSGDAFSQQAAWDATLESLPAREGWRMVAVEGGDHGLCVSGKDGAQRSAAALEEVAAAVRQFLQAAGQRQASGAAQQQPPGRAGSETGEAAAAGQGAHTTEAADAGKAGEDDEEDERRTTRGRRKRRATQQACGEGRRKGR